MNPPKNVAVPCIIQGGESAVCGVKKSSIEPVFDNFGSFQYDKQYAWGRSSAGRALLSHSRGRGFKSLRLHYYSLSVRRFLDALGQNVTAELSSRE